jgi:hypothetical protein
MLFEKPVSCWLWFAPKTVNNGVDVRCISILISYHIDYQ